MASKIKFVPDGNAPFMKCPEHLFPSVGASNPGKKRKEFFLPIFLHKKIIFLNFFNRKDEKGMVKDKISRYLALFWCFDNFFFVILFYTVFKQQDLFELYFIYKNSNLVLVKKIFAKSN
jgi:hypothetical protein